MARYPQREHSSIWPPSAAVRQRSMAVSTFRWQDVSHLWHRSANLGPAARIISATSSGGRSIYFLARERLGAGDGDKGSASSGLAVSPRCFCER